MHGFSSIMKFIIFFVYVPFVYSAITWLRNGEEHHENVDLGELIPNEDETFQKTAILHVAPDEWKKNQYVPVVVHQGNTIQKILTEIESKSKIKSNEKLHTFSTFYIEIYGQTIAGIPEFSAVTTLDGRQIDYYDSEIKKLIPRQDWMKEFVSGDRFKEYTEIREQVQQTNKINITVLMDQFSHSHGVHTYQRMYGCDWDDETGDSQGFDQHGYDGEDFISLDVEELRYISAVLQGVPTMEQWNNDRKQLELLKQYYKYYCVNWLKYFLTLKKADSERRAPEVSLLQKSSSSPVECHATGFYPSAVTITWLRNGQDYDEDVDPGETLPNEDGTFQRTSTIYVTDEWKKNQYVCVVEHMTGKILTENEIKSNNSKFSIVWYSAKFFFCHTVQ
ncbi:major histocompatibility complex class I-related gene protein-like [Onychostoma macrolepis]|uniref:major histocompatibility complex class I-related gene protein-like n=1 Tax=Onychostoma macrolepis TaxID=369639 RepID=UPI00272CDBAB|nr:major histocompatibility complex class I-related gene protein-like [Onychostoma macrolepis]